MVCANTTTAALFIVSAEVPIKINPKIAVNKVILNLFVELTALLLLLSSPLLLHCSAASCINALIYVDKSIDKSIIQISNSL